MTKPPTQEQLTRLSLARYLLYQADRQISQPSPLRCVGLLSLHDSLEIFLDTAAEAVNAPGSRRDFKDFWRCFAAAAPPVNLPMERSIEKINKARVSLKHHGQRPSNDQLRDYVVTSRTFLDEICPLCFGINFEDISMINLVTNVQTRDLLTLSQLRLDEGDLYEAIANVAKAFVHASDIATRKLHYGTATVDLGREIPSQAVRAITSIMRDYDRAIIFLNLGMELQDYNEFRSITPTVQRSANGQFSVLFKKLWTDIGR